LGASLIFEGQTDRRYATNRPFSPVCERAWKSLKEELHGCAVKQEMLGRSNRKGWNVWSCSAHGRRRNSL